MIKSIKITSILGVLFLFVCASDNPNIKSSWVNAKGGLRMRSEPDVNSSVIQNIPNGSKLEIIEEKEPIIEINSKTGKWSKVKYLQSEGWVFGGFLETTKKIRLNVIPDLFRGTWKSTGFGIDNPEDAIFINEKIFICFHEFTDSDLYSYCIIDKFSYSESDKKLSIECKSGDYNLKNYIKDKKVWGTPVQFNENDKINLTINSKGNLVLGNQLMGCSGNEIFR